MTAHIEKRVEALEIDASRADHNLQVVIAEPGETSDQALRRVGIDAAASDVMVVVFE